MFISLAVFVLVCGPADAQSFLERMKERAKNAVEQNIGEKVEKGVNDVLNGKIGLVSIHTGKIDFYDENGRLVRTEDMPED